MKRYVMLGAGLLMQHACVVMAQYPFTIGSPYAEYGKGLTVDRHGTVFVTGYFQGTNDFEPGPGVFTVPARGTGGASDAFLAKYDGNGALVWAELFAGAVDGADKDGIATSAALDPQTNLFSTGKFYGTADLLPGFPVTNMTAAGNADVFVVMVPTDFTAVPEPALLCFAVFFAALIRRT